jgi:hypothetical protein
VASKSLTAASLGSAQRSRLRLRLRLSAAIGEVLPDAKSGDAGRYLGGSDVGFEIPGLGVFVGPNLTPDKETGLGTWTSEQIVTALQTGVRPDGRILAPIMPWRSFAKLTRDDAMAIAAFLKSLPPLKHKVPGPFGPNEKPTVFVMKVVPPESAPPK